MIKLRIAAVAATTLAVAAAAARLSVAQPMGEEPRPNPTNSDLHGLEEPPRHLEGFAGTDRISPPPLAPGSIVTAVISSVGWVGREEPL